LHSDIDLTRKLPLRRRRAGGAFTAAPRDALLAGIAFAALVLVPTAHATTYKWVDDQGVVHYTDKMPPEAINKGNVELNKQGVTIKKTDPALTPEQRRVKEAEEERARQVAKAREEVQRKDRALLASYTTEDEIDLSKKRALGTIEGQMQSAQAYIAILNKRKDEINGRVAALNGKPVPASMEREVASVNDELEKQGQLVAAKRKEITTVTARYDADKQRWRELRNIAEAETAAANAAAAKLPNAAPPKAATAVPAAPIAPAAPAATTVPVNTKK
jgi:hypothetical protein